ncbi:hypothetical protein [Neisseria meningitidis]|uniref:hypothetical protein n=1 Tax=Neisseria meningitidis TaxID=487 RepID=UPI0005DF06B9|nr:hypothetical protein [Neisseria meningitidis]CKJ86460.1 transposase [Neisseria meningitidis]
MPSERLSDGIAFSLYFYSGLTKIRTGDQAADNTNSTEPIHSVLQHLRESFSLSQVEATPYWFLLIHDKFTTKKLPQMNTRAAFC